METIKIICSKRANFYKPESGGVKFRVLSHELNRPIESPAWIQKTWTFADMRKEGTIRIMEDAQESPEMAPVALSGESASEYAEEPESPVEVAAEVVETEPQPSRKRT